jgi:photosystem II stability/assembly factor-like uncharacterized protein
MVRISKRNIFVASIISLCLAFPGACFAQFKWEVIPLPFKGHGLKSVTHSDNRLVAVGCGGEILSSSDGKTWTKINSETNTTIEFVTYVDGKFVAFCHNGTILTSPDGETWSKTISGTKRPIYSATYGNGKFVAVGNYNTILTSPNGTNWTVINPGIHLHRDNVDELRVEPKSVAFGNNQFVVVGESGLVMTSSDATNWTLINEWPGETNSGWTSINKGSGANLNSVIYCKRQFVGVGDNGAISISADGKKWGKINSDIGSDLFCVTYGNSLFLAVGDGTIVSALNCTIWTKENPENDIDIQSVKILSATHYNGRFIAVGNAGADFIIAAMEPSPKTYQENKQKIEIQKLENTICDLYIKYSAYKEQLNIEIEVGKKYGYVDNNRIYELGKGIDYLEKPLETYQKQYQKLTGKRYSKLTDCLQETDENIKPEELEKEISRRYGEMQSMKELLQKEQERARAYGVADKVTLHNAEYGFLYNQKLIETAQKKYSKLTGKRFTVPSKPPAPVGK